MITLTPEQCRIIGVMLEKETTTPEQYPLSINALTNGCNQKSNREPVMSLSEHDVQNVVDELVQMNQLMVERSSGSRVSKYKHRFCNTAFGGLQFSAQERAIVCVLLLRGPQTPGELRSRTTRLADFDDVYQVEETLRSLQQHNGDEFVTMLAKQPGKREARYAHCFSEVSCDVQESGVNEHVIENSNSQAVIDRVEMLEEQVAKLTQELELLKRSSCND